MLFRTQEKNHWRQGQKDVEHSPPEHVTQEGEAPAGSLQHIGVSFDSKYTYYFDFKDELFTKTGMFVFTIFHLTDTHREKVRVTAWQVTQGRGGEGSLPSTQSPRFRELPATKTVT